MTDKQILADCQALVDFANLTDADSGNFPLKHPGFVPEWWWAQIEFSVEEDKVVKKWQRMQHTLRKSWGASFPLESCVELIAAGGMDLRDVGSPLWSGPAGQASKVVWPYQRAVMFLTLNPWRMRFCMGCGKLFVADVPKRKFCSTNSECFASHRRQVKRAWFRQHGKEWRANRKRNKPASTRRKRIGKKHG
jgi:hypothetical protein